MGPGAERLDGIYENTFIHEVMGLSAVGESSGTS
jgi:hypothetical protein